MPDTGEKQSALQGTYVVDDAIRERLVVVAEGTPAPWARPHIPFTIRSRTRSKRAAMSGTRSTPRATLRIMHARHPGHRGRCTTRISTACWTCRPGTHALIQVASTLHAHVGVQGAYRRV